MKAVYVALITPDVQGGYVAEVPDYPTCVTSGETLHETLANVEDALNLCLVGAENLHQEAPTPSGVDSISVPSGSTTTLVSVDTVEYRKKTDQRAVKKSISLPQWMAQQVDRLNVNLSRVTQEALMAILTPPKALTTKNN